MSITLLLDLVHPSLLPSRLVATLELAWSRVVCACHKATLGRQWRSRSIIRCVCEGPGRIPNRLPVDENRPLSPWGPAPPLPSETGQENGEAAEVETEENEEDEEETDIFDSRFELPHWYRPEFYRLAEHDWSWQFSLAFRSAELGGRVPDENSSMAQEPEVPNVQMRLWDGVEVEDEDWCDDTRWFERTQRRQTSEDDDEEQGEVDERDEDMTAAPRTVVWIWDSIGGWTWHYAWDLPSTQPEDS